MSLRGGQTEAQLPALDYDRAATDSFYLEMSKSEVPLQFPPKITSDSKSANWNESHHHGFEELSLYYGSFARKVNLELNFVLWGEWDWAKISKSVRAIKYHLYVGGGENAIGDKMPFFFVKGWRVIDGESKPPSFRLMNVGVEYSREYVGSGVNYWPLHTKVNMECKLFTGTGSSPDKSYWLKLKGYDAGDLPGSALVEWA